MEQHHLRESAPTADDLLEYIPKAERDKIPTEDFAWPDAPGGPKFPCDTQDHVDSCAKLLGHAPEGVQGKIKARAKSIAKRHGFSIPDSWKDDAKESAFAPSALGKNKVATLKTVFLEDNAISLNGRQYTKAAVDRLVQSAQIQLSDPDALPMTCYISHDAADQDNSLLLAGKITNVWREGTKAWASIDLVNTDAGRAMTAQTAGGFLKSMSLRASNAEIKREKDASWPTVGGDALRLDGIDFTSTPGISVAKIQNVALAENAREGPQRLHEVFYAHAPLLEMEQKETGMDKLNEADVGGNTVGGYTPTSGLSPSMDGSPSGGSYGDRLYKLPTDTTGSAMQGMDKQGSPLELEEAHDRSAMIQGRSCAPSRESAAWGRAFASMDTEQRKQYAQTLTVLEAGRSISARNDKHLDVIHDALARHLGKSCVGESSKPRGGRYDPDGDGDDDSTNDPVKNPDWAQDQQNDLQSAKPRAGLKEQKHKEQEEMPPTPEEMARALEAAGYKIEKPKSDADLLEERRAADKAEQEQRIAALQEQHAREMAELKEMLKGSQVSVPDPQRRSQVLGANVGAQTATKATVYMPGKYLRENMRPDKWSTLADRTIPLPSDLNLELALRELTDLRIVQHFDRFGWPENLAPLVDRA